MLAEADATSRSEITAQSLVNYEDAAIPLAELPATA